MREQGIKMGLRGVGDVVIKVFVAAAMLGCVIWLFAPDTWFSGKLAAVVALLGIPTGFFLYALTRLVGWITSGSRSR